MVMYAPGGVAALIMMNLRIASFGHLGKVFGAYLAMAGAGIVAFLGASAMVEMIYHLQLTTGEGSTLSYLGTVLDAKKASSWFGAGFVLATGLFFFEVVRRQYMQQWDEIQEEIEKEIKRREAI